MDKQSIPNIVKVCNNTLGHDYIGSDIKYIQDVGPKYTGSIYVDRNNGHTYRCVQDTTSTDNVGGMFFKCSLTDLALISDMNVDKDQVQTTQLYTGNSHAAGYCCIDLKLNLRTMNWISLDITNYMYSTSKVQNVNVFAYSYEDRIIQIGGITNGSNHIQPLRFVVDKNLNVKLYYPISDIYCNICAAKLKTYGNYMYTDKIEISYGEGSIPVPSTSTEYRVPALSN